MLWTTIFLAFIGLNVDGPKSNELPTDVFIDWSYHNNAGWIAVNRQYLDVAEREFGAAIRKIQPYSQGDPRLLARTYNDLAWVLYRQGRSKEASPLAEWALIVRESRVGPNSEPVAQTLYILAMIESDLGQLDLAETHLTRALAIHETRFPASSDKVITARLDLATVQIARRKFTQAESSLNRILKLPATTLDENDPYRALAHSGLADLARGRGQLDEAKRHLNLAIDIYGKGNPPDLVSSSRLTEILRSIVEENGGKVEPH